MSFFLPFEVPGPSLLLFSSGWNINLNNLTTGEPSHIFCGAPVHTKLNLLCSCYCLMSFSLLGQPKNTKREEGKRFSPQWFLQAGQEMSLAGHCLLPGCCSRQTLGPLVSTGRKNSYQASLLGLHLRGWWKREL